MDNQLMPPSHFDPSEQDSLEVVHDSPDGAFIVPHVLNAKDALSSATHLRPPQDFTSVKWKLAEESAMASSRFHAQHQAPPQVSRNPSFPAASAGRDFHLPSQKESTNCSDVVRLQAVNDTLRSLLETKKADIEAQLQQKDHCASRQAVIEHQTEHIARLQKDLEEQKFILNKRENENLQYETAVAAKEKELRQMTSSVERLESQLDKKIEEEKMKGQEIEDLQKIIGNARAEKAELIESHLASLKSVEEEYTRKKENVLEDFRAQREGLVACHAAEIDGWKQKAEKMETQQRKQVEDLRSDLEREKMDWKKDLEEKLLIRDSAAKKFEGDFTSEKSRAESMLEALNQEKSEKESLQATVNELKYALESSQEACEKQTSRLNQLQAYIGQQQTENYERSQWKTFKKQYEENIMALQAEKESMMKTAELQNIRLQSITKILTTQEEAINANAKAFTTGNVRGNPAHVVIRRWREKVFELMVQCKSGEITMRALKDEHTLAKNDLKDQLEEEGRVSIILENQLSECKAQVEILRRENDRLSANSEKHSESLSQALKDASDKEEAVVAMSEEVAKSTAQLCRQFQDKFTHLVEKTVHLDQRLTFANNRMRTLHDLFIRRENVWKAKLQRINERAAAVKEPATTLEIDELALQMETPGLRAEIAKLTEERDALSRKLCSDSAAFTNATVEFRDREAALEKDLLSLQHEIQHKSEEIAGLKIQIESIEEKLVEKEREAADAKECAKLAEENQDKAVEEKLSEAWKTWDKEKRELEKMLEESQREHARTVVASRQSERSTVREQKRAAENLEAVAEEHRKETERLRRKLNASKRDNNLLMTTLRQQGLLSTFKAARMKARMADDGRTHLDDKSPKSSHCDVEKTMTCCRSPVRDGVNASKPSTSQRGSPRPHVGNATPTYPNLGCDNMAEMLKDLVVLTEDILHDSDESA